jgi:hypothetical protein
MSGAIRPAKRSARARAAAGDPGLGSVLSGIGKGLKAVAGTVLKVASPVIKASPIGGVLTAAQVVGSGLAKLAQPGAKVIDSGEYIGTPGIMPGGGVSSAPQIVPMYQPPPQVPLLTQPNMMQPAITQAGVGDVLVQGGKYVLKNAPAIVGAIGTGLGIAEATGLTDLIPTFGRAAMMPRGYHKNKAVTRYEVAKANGHKVQDPRSEPRVKNDVVRNRSMNVLNPRALRRAWARAEGAKKWARKLIRFDRKATVAHRGHHRKK